MGPDPANSPECPLCHGLPQPHPFSCACSILRAQTGPAETETEPPLIVYLEPSETERRRRVLARGRLVALIDSLRRFRLELIRVERSLTDLQKAMD
jgi:hypothetical protein